MQKNWLPLAQWLGVGVLAGLLCGGSSALFLTLLNRATSFRVEHGALVWGLPLAGLVLGWVYESYGREALPGSNLILERLQGGGPQLPLGMAPLVLFGTVWTHLFGGSAGREGTGVQMGASLADGAAHALRLDPKLRRHMLAAGVAGGFASVFGTPVAGLLFGLEVIVVGRMDYEALVPALVAALVGDWTVRALGVHHAVYPVVAMAEPTLLMGAKWLVLAAALAALAWVFVELTHKLKAWAAGKLPSLPLRLALGGLVVALLSQLPGMSVYLGLSTELIQQALSGAGVPAWSFLAKLSLTVLTLGFGFIGGEVTPLFVMGACLGAALAVPLGLPVPLAAGVGLAALFGAAANTPLAMVAMAVELLGPGVLPHVALVAVFAYLLTGRRGIYTAQGWHRSKLSAEAPAKPPLKPQPKRKR